jgi:hypothetical protein
MKQIVKFFILSILYWIFLFFYTWSNLLLIKKDTYPTKNLYKDMIKSGDILMLSNTKNHKILGDLVFMIDYFHPSIALWDEGNLFVLEYAFYPGLEGLNKVPFGTWLKFNKNKKILHCPLKVEKKNMRENVRRNLLNFFNNNQERINKMDSDIHLDWLRFVFRTKSNLKLKNISCTEVLALAIYESGIAKKDKGISYYHQSDFIQLKNFNLNKGLSYPESYKCDPIYLIKTYI